MEIEGVIFTGLGAGTGNNQCLRMPPVRACRYRTKDYSVVGYFYLKKVSSIDLDAVKFLFDREK